MIFRAIKWSLVDQLIVSGGTFLTIASCARLLPLGEQGKFGYVLTGYMAALIFNMTAIFQWASVEAPRVQDKKAYRRNLAQLQTVLAVGFSLLIAILIYFIEINSDERIEFGGLVAFMFFLFVQQLADFDRRLAYIIFDAKRAVKSSALVYLLRMVIIWILQPADIIGVLFVLIIAAIIPAFITLLCAVEKIGSEIWNIFSNLRLHIYKVRWFVASGPLVWIWSSLPVFVLGWGSSLAAVGVFVTVRSLANMSNVALELLETHVSAAAGRLYVADKTSFHLLMLRVRKYGFLIWGIGLVVVITLGRSLLDMIYGELYARYEPIFIILWMANGLVFLFRLNAVELRVANSSRVVAQGYMWAVAAMMLVAFPLTAYYGIGGAAVMVLVGATVNYISQRLSNRLGLLS